MTIFRIVILRRDRAPRRAGGYLAWGRGLRLPALLLRFLDELGVKRFAMPSIGFRLA
jgi:hypothetical protein